MPKKYEVVETMAVLKRDRTSRGYQFSVEQLEVESLIQDYYDFKPHENKRVKVIIMIEENEEVKPPWDGRYVEILDVNSEDDWTDATRIAKKASEE